MAISRVPIRPALPSSRMCSYVTGAPDIKQRKAARLPSVVPSFALSISFGLPKYYGRQRRNLRFELQLLQPFLEPCLKEVGPLSCLAGVEPGIGPAGLFLQLKL